MEYGVDEHGHRGSEPAQGRRRERTRPFEWVRKGWEGENMTRLGRYIGTTLVLAAILVGIAATPARASFISLTCFGTPCGSGSITQEATDIVEVAVTMTGGYQLQSDAANTIRFNIPGVTSVTVNDISLNGGAEDATSQTLNAGSFNEASTTLNYELGGVGNLTLFSLGFDVSAPGLLVSNFQPNSDGFVVDVHFCSPDSDKCPDPTGFGGGELSGAPEPGTLILFGTGALAVAGAIRRHSRASVLK